MKFKTPVCSATIKFVILNDELKLIGDILR